MSAQNGEYDMDQVILDLGSVANFMPKKSWEMVGEPRLEWSTI